MNFVYLNLFNLIFKKKILIIIIIIIIIIIPHIKLKKDKIFNH